MCQSVSLFHNIYFYKYKYIFYQMQFIIMTIDFFIKQAVEKTILGRKHFYFWVAGISGEQSSKPIYFR